jgi:hypothetical protein
MVQSPENPASSSESAALRMIHNLLREITIEIFDQVRERIVYQA